MNGTVEVNELLKWLAAAMATVIATTAGWLHRGQNQRIKECEERQQRHDERLQLLEMTRVAKADADLQRQGLRDEIKEFRGEINARVDGMRREMTEELRRLYDQIAKMKGSL